MFERYTEKARRAIFFARYEASQFGAQAIEAEHILLGLLREDKQLAAGVFGDSHSGVAAIRKEIEDRAPLRDRVPASVDLPLSTSAKNVLSSAAAESDRLGHRHIGTEHLLLGSIKETRSIAGKILKERGITEEKVVAWINQQSEPHVSGEIGGATGIFAISGGVADRAYPQVEPLIAMLAERGIITREEFNTAFIRRLGPAGLRIAFDALLDLLVSKGVINEDDRRKINNAE